MAGRRVAPLRPMAKEAMKKNTQVFKKKIVCTKCKRSEAAPNSDWCHHCLVWCDEDGAGCGLYGDY